MVDKAFRFNVSGLRCTSEQGISDKSCALDRTLTMVDGKSVTPLTEQDFLMMFAWTPIHSLPEEKMH